MLRERLSAQRSRVLVRNASRDGTVKLLDAANKRLHPFIVGDKGTAEEALNGLSKDWQATFKKYKRVQ